ncbi:MAG: DUF2752 domain-containing protein [Deltaproteobacteria bacterium]|nr:DUF2752 domain-containing protein [Deltaproteobacteria bacterium]
MRALALIDRKQPRPSWAEGSFWLIAAGVHVIGLRIAQSNHYPVHVPKWFDMTFGVPSPTSGTTRAIVALDGGRLGEALLYNPVATIAGAFAWVFLLYLPISLLSGRAIAVSEPLRRGLTWTALGLLAATWLGKLAFVPRVYW